MLASSRGGERRSGVCGPMTSIGPYSANCMTGTTRGVSASVGCGRDKSLPYELSLCPARTWVCTQIRPAPSKTEGAGLSLYIQLFRTRPRKFARGRASSHGAAQVRTGPRKFVQGCASNHHRAGACGQRRNRRPVSSASTVRVSPGAWLPAMISLAIIVSTWAWI